MKRTDSLILSLLALSVAIFTGCSSGPLPLPSASTIEVEDKQTLTQIVFADDTEGESVVTFTTSGVWMSKITEEGQDTSPEWIWIDPNSGKEAGKYNIHISLLQNFTSADRKAVIEIACGKNEITINVTQRGVTANGKPQIDPSLIAVTVEGGMNYNEIIDYVAAISYYTENKGIEVGRAPYENGGFTLKLDPEPGGLSTFDFDANKLEISDVKAKGITLKMEGFKSKTYVGDFFMENVYGYSGRYYYMDRDVSITGSYSESVAIYTINNSYDLNFKKGWNIVYEQVVTNLDKGVITMIFTTQPQNEMRWYFKPEQKQ
ncbi:MAG: BACON domain-containing protein [Prevotellaceae bacterium]|jgi:hypothetical protein|nr:BACON domain-containing protein [Prevotellaceae bacterium]